MLHRRKPPIVQGRCHCRTRQFRYLSLYQFPSLDDGVIDVYLSTRSAVLTYVRRCPPPLSEIAPAPTAGLALASTPVVRIAATVPAAVPVTVIRSVPPHVPVLLVVVILLGVHAADRKQTANADAGGVDDEADEQQHRERHPR